MGLPGGFGERIGREHDERAYSSAILCNVGVGDMILADGDVATVTDAADVNIVRDGAAHALVVVVPSRLRPVFWRTALRS